MKKESVYQLVLAGLLTALGILLPSIFHAFGVSGSIFLPMHIPVLLCGMLCGYRLGGLCGILVPLLSSLITGMPPMYPVAVYMICELAAYGLIAGLLIKKTNVIVSLIGALIGGRVVLALAQLVIMGFGGNTFALNAFVTSAFVTALPGIIVQIIVVPLIVILVNKITKRAKIL